MGDLLNQAVKVGTHYLQKGFISTACSVAETYVQLQGGSKEEVDKSALELARFVTMKPGGYAEKYLNHFLTGNGTDMPLSLKVLLTDTTVRARIELELCRKISNVKVGVENGPICYDSAITLFQHTYSNPDWWYALGTFDIKWEHVQFSAGFHYIMIYGENEYRWYPEQNRITQCIHRAGEKVASDGKGRNFKIVAEPLLITISEAQREMVAMLSVAAWKPRGNSGGIELNGLKERAARLFSRD